MQALFVHGMGRTPLSGARMLGHLKNHGITTYSFFYSVTFESVRSIEGRLRKKITQIANRGDYILVGHSLGGVLIRSALASLSAETRMPNRVFLLGSPVRPSRIAKYLRRNWLFYLATRDCGQLLSSDERMQNIPPCSVPTTSFVGTSGIYGRFTPFGSEVNDSVVAASEITADWITEELRVPENHTWMPSSIRVATAIVERTIGAQHASHSAKQE